MYSNDTDKYSFHDINNYKLTFTDSPDAVIANYARLLIEYIHFIMDNIKITNTALSKFIIIRGLNTITSVYLYLFYYTKNVDFTYYHCQKSYYFYVEFISQISEDEKMFLQLTSKDAVSYVYKKTIYEISNEKKIILKDDSPEFREKINQINGHVNLYQTYLIKLIQSDSIDIVTTNKLMKLFETINHSANNSMISILEKITDKLYYTIESGELFFEINYLLVKIFSNNPDSLKNVEQKMNSYEFYERIDDLNKPAKFVKWLIS